LSFAKMRYRIVLTAHIILTIEMTRSLLLSVQINSINFKINNDKIFPVSPRYVALARTAYKTQLPTVLILHVDSLWKSVYRTVTYQ
jgi:hypothetical protein